VLAWIVFCLALSLALGCGRPNAPHGTETGASSPAGPSDQNLPFHPNPDRTSDADNALPPMPADHQRDNGTPFHSLAAARSLPAGTLITIRMESSLSTSHVSAGDPFTASVAGPLTVDGNTLVERGTPVSGRVESAQPPAARPGLSPDPGYVRLTLSALTLDGRAVALQTSSLFARGTFQSSAASVDAASRVRSSDFRVQKGRPLTFRLTAPVALNDPSSIANRQNPGPPNE
jgi:hypothetical protein